MRLTIRTAVLVEGLGSVVVNLETNHQQGHAPNHQRLRGRHNGAWEQGPALWASPPKPKKLAEPLAIAFAVAGHVLFEKLPRTSNQVPTQNEHSIVDNLIAKPNHKLLRDRTAQHVEGHNA